TSMVVTGGLYLRIQRDPLPACFNDAQLAVPMVHPVLRPQVKGAGDRLPQDERDHQQGGQEVPAPRAPAHVARAQNRYLRPTWTERGSPACRMASSRAARSRTLNVPT